MPPQQYLLIRIYPNARRCEIRGIREDGVICIGVQAPPVDGKANAALREFIAAQLGIKNGSSPLPVAKNPVPRWSVLAIRQV